jgi:hypothetical protein
MAHVNIIDQIIEINEEVSPSVLVTEDTTNTYITDVTNGFQSRFLDGSGDPNDPITLAINGLTDLTSITNFLKEVTGDDAKDHPEFDITHWSSKQIMALQQKITDQLKDKDADKSAIGTLMGQVQGFQSTFNAFTTKELATPQAVQKAEQGVISTTSTRLQVILDAANSVMSWLGLFANLPKS